MGPAQVPALTEYHYVRVVSIEGSSARIPLLSPDGTEDECDEDVDVSVLLRRSVCTDERKQWPGHPVAFVHHGGPTMDEWAFGVVTSYRRVGAAAWLHTHRPELEKFRVYMEKQWLSGNFCNWQIFKTPSGFASTNDCWPYSEIKVNIIGFAVKEASLLAWTDDSLGTITVCDLDSDGVPQCDPSCHRFYDYGAGSWSDTSSCKGEPFDISLWPKQGLEGGFGYNWGQEVNLENMLQTIDEEQLVIVAHEIGHDFGLPDFYETADKPNDQWPNCIMMAGSSMTVTDSDDWIAASRPRAPETSLQLLSEADRHCA